VLSDPAVASSCMEVTVGGHVVYQHQAATGLLPASNLKLLTALAALRRLGPAARLSTTARFAPPRGGVVDGPLWLVGGGDPLLVSAGFRATEREFTWAKEPGTALEALADKVKAMGVNTITGGVMGDDSRYDSERALPTWKPSYLSDGEIGAVGALVVNGGFVSFGLHVPTPAPATEAAATFTSLLAERGIRVFGHAGHGSVAPGATGAVSIESLPLSDIVGVMLRESDNLSAELLTKELGYRYGGAGTWAAGTKVIVDTLRAAGLPMAGVTLHDGSGLDRGDRATCAVLIATLGAGGANLAGALPLAAKEGSLAQRLIGHPSAGRLRAKTGSLEGVAALTGTLVPSHSPAPALDFALLVNNIPSDAFGRLFEDMVADVLAAYPGNATVAGLGPAVS
jgi:D-alanyl-D-alanine carboxypeptidase/D-alanyl-D-alanine-endopeptidase (penicillin-binding protein 4)